LGPHGEYTGYTVQELPRAYRPGDIITTDNSVSKNLWVNHFGFIANDILIHHQLFDCATASLPSPTSKDGLNILWAAHIRPEKNPEILPEIAESLKPDKVNIDCYGFFSPQNWADEENPLETNIENLHYKGPYNDFFKDIDLTKYDLFLYTSHADGTPNVIIEAALAGLPIVASRIGGIPETLGDHAILVDDTFSVDQFTQAIRSTLSNLSHSRQQANTLQQSLIQKHSKTNFIQQVKEMLKRSQS
jgi:glycosyltransferase involved in cell wall biosynthesis